MSFVAIPGKIGKRSGEDRAINEAEFEAIARGHIPTYIQSGVIGTQKSELSKFATTIGSVAPENNVFTLVRLDPLFIGMYVNQSRIKVAQAAPGATCSFAIYQLISSSFAQVPGTQCNIDCSKVGLVEKNLSRSVKLSAKGEYYLGTYIEGGYPALFGYNFSGGSLFDVMTSSPKLTPVMSIGVDELERVPPLNVPIISYLTPKAGGLL